MSGATGLQRDTGLRGETVDQVTERLLRWIAAIAPDVTCGQDGAGPDARPDLLVTLAAIRPSGSAMNAGQSELMLSYDCTPRDGAAAKVQRALGEIAFAALEGGDYTVGAPEAGPLRLTLGTRLVRDRDRRRGPRVRVPPKARLQPARLVSGVLAGPDGSPVAGASVTVAGGRPDPVQTDADGRFRVLVPDGTAAGAGLAVTFRGRHGTAVASGGRTDGSFILTLEG